MTTKFLIDFAITLVGFVVYVNAGWFFIYFLLNPRKAGIFKNFLLGPECLIKKEEKEAQLNEDNNLTAIHPLFVIIWSIVLVVLLIAWLIQPIIWFVKTMFGKAIIIRIGKSILRMGKMTFGGGIAKKIVGEE